MTLRDCQAYHVASDLDCTRLAPHGGNHWHENSEGAIELRWRGGRNRPEKITTAVAETL